MANISFFTGFEGCGSSADTAAFFDAVSRNTYHATNGYDNGKCVYSNTWYLWIGEKACSGSTIVTGMHIRNPGAFDFSTDARQGLVHFFQGTTQIKVFLTTDYYLRVYIGSTLIATSTVTIPSTGIAHFEFKIYSHSSEGTVQVKHNQTLVIDESNVNTGGDDFTKVRYGNMVANAYFDNIFIADDWVGELKSVLLQPTSDDSVQFTPSAGSDNYAMIDDTAQDGDTTYVESGTNGHKDRYGFSDLDAGLDPKVLTVVGVAKKTDVGAVSLKLQSQQGITNYDLDTFTLSADYPAAVQEGQFVTLDTCPDNTTALSRNEVNDLKFGFEAVI